jgi:CPA2 family monovalent cation:H+ antiporter-2
MESHPVLIETIAIGLSAAFIGGFAARRLGLPPIVGYLVAGILVGPHTPGLVADTAVAQELAELGIILLMFGVGIEFSIPDLLSVRRIAIPGAIGQSAVATVLGTLLGVALGWGLGGGIVLGLAISVASTVVLLRGLEDRGEVDTQQGRIAIGWLIVEDLFTVIVLVLLPSLAPVLRGEAGAGPADALLPLVTAIAKAAAFAILMLIVGTRVVPRILEAVARDRSRELFTLSVLAIAIGIAFSASAVFGVSFALGAFFAGVVLAERDVSHHAAANALPLRDAFAVLFFVSVGMLVDPGYIVANPVAVLAVTGLVVFAKSAAALTIVSLFGYPIRTGLTVAAALAQVGEFSFILATLGLSLRLIPEEAFQLVVAAALVSITLNPVSFRIADLIDARIRARPRLLARLERGAPAALAQLPGDTPVEHLRGHAVVCGYGRVSRMVIAALERRAFRYVVVSSDKRQVEDLRARDIPALFGDAANPELLREARLDQARVAIVAMSDPHAVRLIVDRVREEAPRVPLVIRTHSRSESVALRATGPAVQSVYAEGELAVQMARFALRRFGVSSAEVEAIAQGLRASGGGEPGVPRPVPPRPPVLGRVRDWLASARGLGTRAAEPESRVEAALEAPDRAADAEPTPPAA